jgi:hypothetical protein
MVGMNRINVCFIVVFLSIVVVNASDSASSIAINTVVSPQVKLGSHQNSVGIRAAFKFERLFNRFSTGLFIESTSRFDVTCLSIPGSQYEVSFYTGPEIAFGGKTCGYSPWTASQLHRRHNIRFTYIVHLDNRSTSQASGSLQYLFSSDHFSAGLLFEDDFLALQNRDAYRTGALEAALWIDPSFLPFSFSLFGGTKIWTGAATGSKSAGEVYDLSSSRYGHYSTGILYIGAGVNTVRLSIGWDSEKIRNAIQNSFHRAINDGAIPVLPEREERLFFNITIGDAGSLY